MNAKIKPIIRLITSFCTVKTLRLDAYLIARCFSNLKLKWLINRSEWVIAEVKESKCRSSSILNVFLNLINSSSPFLTAFKITGCTIPFVQLLSHYKKPVSSSFRTTIFLLLCHQLNVGQFFNSYTLSLVS